MKYEKSILIDLLGKCPETKVWDWLLTFGDLGFTLNDVPNCIPINRKRAYDICKKLIKKNIIIKDKKVKNIQFYKLNKREPRVRAMIKLDNVCLVEDEDTKKILNKK